MALGRILHTEHRIGDNGDTEVYIVYAKDKPGKINTILRKAGRCINYAGYRMAVCGERIRNKGARITEKKASEDEYDRWQKGYDV
jgi:hypothetical protein